MRAGAKSQGDIASRMRVVIDYRSAESEDRKRMHLHTSISLQSRASDTEQNFDARFGPISCRSTASKNNASVSGWCADAAVCFDSTRAAWGATLRLHPWGCFSSRPREELEAARTSQMFGAVLRRESTRPMQFNIRPIPVWMQRVEINFL